MPEVFVLSIELTTECPLRCPFCYARPRHRSRDRWSAEELRALAREVREIFGPGSFVMVYGGGEPTTCPELLGEALRIALDEGSLYTSFTTDAALLDRDTTRRIEERVGGALAAPQGFATLSIDGYKLVAGPRGDPRRIDPALLEAWREARPLLTFAARRWGVELPEEPPRVLEVATLLWERGWDYTLNIMVTNDLLPLLDPPLPDQPEPSPGMALIYGLARRALQIQFLAPKPLRGLLSIRQLPGARYGGPALGSVLRTALWWASRGPCRLAADQAMARILGLEVPGAEPGRFCAAGRRLVSLDPHRMAAPCSFAPHTKRWKPGRLGEILEAFRDAAPRLVEGCPYL